MIAALTDLKVGIDYDVGSFGPASAEEIHGSASTGVVAAQSAEDERDDAGPLSDAA